MEDYLISKIENIAFSKVGVNDPLWNTGVLDSINIIELSVELENELKIQIPFDEIVIENFQTVATLAAYIRKKQGHG